MTRGGKRKGAGRPAGSGMYGEPTKAIRVPQSMVDQIKGFAAKKGFALPIYTSKVQAGVPFPADDHNEEKLDLNAHLIRNPAATFFVKVSGSSMINAGIHENDILIVDRSVEAANGKIVIAAVDGQLTVKRLKKTGDQTQLIPENDQFQPIDISNDNDVHIWGVVTNVIHSV